MQTNKNTENAKLRKYTIQKNLTTESEEKTDCKNYSKY